MNQTLQWNVPLGYSESAAGWLVLAFRALVLVPLVVAFPAGLAARAESTDRRPSRAR